MLARHSRLSPAVNSTQTLLCVHMTTKRIIYVIWCHLIMKRTSEVWFVSSPFAFALLIVVIRAMISNPEVGHWHSIQHIFIPDATSFSLWLLDQNIQATHFQYKFLKRKTINRVNLKISQNYTKCDINCVSKFHKQSKFEFGHLYPSSICTCWLLDNIKKLLDLLNGS